MFGYSILKTMHYRTTVFSLLLKRASLHLRSHPIHLLPRQSVASSRTEVFNRNMDESVLSAVRAAMMSAKVPSAYDKVYKVRSAAGWLAISSSSLSSSRFPTHNSCRPPPSFCADSRTARSRFKRPKKTPNGRARSHALPPPLPHKTPRLHMHRHTCTRVSSPSLARSMSHPSSP